MLRTWGRPLSEFGDMPQVVGDWGLHIGGNRLLNEQLDYSREQLINRVEANCAQFNMA